MSLTLGDEVFDFRVFCCKYGRLIKPRQEGMASANLALQSVLSPVIAVAAGVWLDRKYGWSPWGLVASGAVGVTMSVILIRELLRQMKKDDASEHEHNDSKPNK